MQRAQKAILDIMKENKEFDTERQARIVVTEKAQKHNTKTQQGCSYCGITNKTCKCIAFVKNCTRYSCSNQFESAAVPIKQQQMNWPLKDAEQSRRHAKTMLPKEHQLQEIDMVWTKLFNFHGHSISHNYQTVNKT